MEDVWFCVGLCFSTFIFHKSHIDGLASVFEFNSTKMGVFVSAEIVMGVELISSNGADSLASKPWFEFDKI